MNIFSRPYSRIWTYSAGVLFVVASTSSCYAMSRMPQAQIKDEDGIPCFAIPDEAGVYQGTVRLFALSVTEAKRTNWQTPPAEAWAFTIEPPGNSVEISPQSCIRYGEAPLLAKVKKAVQPLQQYRLYVVFIEARPTDGAIAQLGYKAEFCMKPTSDEKVMVQVVPWDLAAKRWRYEVCVKPKP